MRGPSLSQRIAQLGQRLALEAHIAWLAARDPETPLLARVIAIAVAAYALSPIDLVPDFIPILGWIDDLLIVPAGLYVARRLVPKPLWQRYRAQAETESARPKSRAGMVFILTLWAIGLYLLYWTVRTAPVH
jgi:uncharacterized membrane protein YkvA (DUF1232 family)